MTSRSQHDFVASQYGPRAGDYASSPVHSSGEDLDQFEALLRARPGGRVLDLGCGGGHVSYRAAPHAAEVVACDLTPEMLDVVQHTARVRGLNNVTVREAAAEALPFETGMFDVVLCRFSAHHWQDLEAGLRETRRVLRPDGVAAFIDTVAPDHPLLDTYLQTMELLRDASHVRNYRVAEWIAALERSALSAGWPWSSRAGCGAPGRRPRMRASYARSRMVRRHRCASISRLVPMAASCSTP